MQSGQEVVYLHLDDIIPNRFQPREVFDERALKELAASIKEHGVIQPIIVRQVNNKYEIIAGERRYKASALAGMTKIPAIINNLDDKEAAKVALLENLQRKNLNPIEEARTYQKILELDQMTQETLAKTMGKSQSAVANKLRLLALPDEIQRALLKENISERHARTLLNLKNPEQQKKMLKRIIAEKMSVRTLEEEIRKINDPQESLAEGGQMQNNNINTNNQTPSYQVPSPAAMFSQNTNQKPNLMDSFEEQNRENDNIVNYGEIDEDEIAHANEPSYDSFTSSANKEINVNQLKSNATDIDNILSPKKEDTKAQQDEQKQKISGDLDSLLNIAPPTNNSFNLARDAINDNDNNENNSKDYFQAPDLMSVQLPNSSNNANAIIKDYNTPQPSESIIDFTNNSVVDNKKEHLTNFSDANNTLFENKKAEPQKTKPAEKTLGMALIEETYKLNPKEKAKQYNIHQMVQQIRDTIQTLQRMGAKIDTDEMDFENQYQMVIRIDKNSIN
jgi:ParB/RepB/Spo0J family partition protein